MDLERAYAPGDGDTIDRLAWFADLDNILERQLLGSDLHPRAGLSKRQISDRYSYEAFYVPLVPHIGRNSEAGDAVIGSYSAGASTYLTPANGSAYSVDLLPVIIPAGTQAWLMGVASKIRRIQAGGAGELPQLSILKGTDVLGGGPQIHSVQDRWYNLMSDPLAVGGLRPLIDIQLGEYLYANIESTAGAGTDARVQGWDLWVFLKLEHSR